MAMVDKIQKLVYGANKIVVIQADNPDGDSVASALALEHILEDQGKKCYLYCGIEVPSYLRYLSGWDRIVNEMPTQFDLSIIVDTSSVILLESLQKSGSLNWLKSRPSIIIDHHQSESTIDFTEVNYLQKAAATGEVIYELATSLKWPINVNAKKLLASAILSDTLGLMTEAVSARTVHVVGELVEQGVSLAELDEARRKMAKKTKEILAYKGRLLERVEYSEDLKIASVTIPWEEIEKYSHQYNPSMLVLDEMRQVENVVAAIAFKTYPNKRITAKIRTNLGYPIAAQLAESFGGGGHKYAAGFKITDERPYDDLKIEVFKRAGELIDKLTISSNDEAIQYA